MTAAQHTLNVLGLACPLPILKAKKALAQLETGDVLTVLATDGGAPDDFAAFCRQTGHELLSSVVTTGQDGEMFEIVVRHK